MIILKTTTITTATMTTTTTATTIATTTTTTMWSFETDLKKNVKSKNKLVERGRRELRPSCPKYFIGASNSAAECFVIVLNMSLLYHNIMANNFYV